MCILGFYIAKQIIIMNNTEHHKSSTPQLDKTQFTLESWWWLELVILLGPLGLRGKESIESTVLQEINTQCCIGPLDHVLNSKKVFNFTLNQFRAHWGSYGKVWQGYLQIWTFPDWKGQWEQDTSSAKEQLYVIVLLYKYKMIHNYCK